MWRICEILFKIWVISNIAHLFLMKYISTKILNHLSSIKEAFVWESVKSKIKQIYKVY